MLNHSASLAMSTSVLKALPGKLDIKRHTPSTLYVSIITLFIEIETIAYYQLAIASIVSVCNSIKIYL